MAHILRIRGASPLPFSLSSHESVLLRSSVMLRHYTPKTPEIASTSPSAGEDDGGEVSNLRYNNVTETIELSVLGISAGGGLSTTLAQDAFNTIEKFLYEARRYQKYRTGSKVYLEYQVDGDTHFWRSEILFGRLELQQDAMQIWGNAHIPCLLHITRRYYWERTGALTEIRLTSAYHTTPKTAGVWVYNSNAGGTVGNYVQISGTEIVGDLPAPAKIQLQNITGASQSYRNFYIANNAFNTASVFAHTMEGESSVYGTQVNAAGCSGGKYMQTSFSGTTFFLWPMTTRLLYGGGRTFRILARFATYPLSTPVYVRAVLANEDGLLPVATGEEVKLPADGSNIYELVDLGSLPLPPNGNGLPWDTMTLKLEMRAASNATVGLDYIQLMPTEEYRHIVMRGGLMIANGALLDDGTEGKTYMVEDGANKPYFSPRGSYINVYPGITQRLYFLHDEGTVSDINNVSTVFMWYRPRRLTI